MTSKNAKPNTSRKDTSIAASERRKPSGAHGQPSTRRPAAATRAARAAAFPTPTCPRIAAAGSAGPAGGKEPPRGPPPRRPPPPKKGAPAPHQKAPQSPGGAEKRGRSDSG